MRRKGAEKRTPVQCKPAYADPAEHGTEYGVARRETPPQEAKRWREKRQRGTEMKRRRPAEPERGTGEAFLQ